MDASAGRESCRHGYAIEQHDPLGLSTRGILDKSWPISTVDPSIRKSCAVTPIDTDRSHADPRHCNREGYLLESRATGLSNARMPWCCLPRWVMLPAFRMGRVKPPEPAEYPLIVPLFWRRVQELKTGGHLSFF